MELLKKVPDPKAREKKFISFMGNKGSQLNTLVKDMEKLYERAKKQATDRNIDLDTVDTGNIKAIFEGAQATVRNLIHLSAFISLLRSPDIATSEMNRGTLQKLYKDFENDPTLSFVPEWEEDYLKVVDLSAAPAAEAEAPPRKKHRATVATDAN